MIFDKITLVPTRPQPDIPRFREAITPRFLLINNDSVANSVMRHHLKVNFPQACIDVCQSREILEAPSGYHVYFIEETPVAPALQKAIRSTSPKALVLTLSAASDLPDGRDLPEPNQIIYNVRRPMESQAARNSIRSHLEKFENKPARSRRLSFLAFARSFNRASG